MYMVDVYSGGRRWGMGESRGLIVCGAGVVVHVVRIAGALGKEVVFASQNVEKHWRGGLGAPRSAPAGHQPRGG